MELVPRETLSSPCTQRVPGLPTLHEEPEKEGPVFINITKKHHSNDDSNSSGMLTTAISAFYGKFLVVLGLALPITATIVPDATATTYDAFYLYLYLGSLLFLLYMYAGVMTEEVVQTVSRKTSAFEMSNKKMRPSGSGNSQQICYGSFYLRMGIAAFGVGTMIHAVLHFGMYFELSREPQCHDILVALTPLAQATFVIMQMIFIFSDNNKLVEEYSCRVVARFGLMHMIATNLCEWLFVVVEETKYDITNYFNSTVVKVINGSGEGVEWTYDFPSDCWNSHIMAPLVRAASHFLFPCTVEYSLLCAVILGVMWSNACSEKNSAQLKHSLSQDGATERQSGVNIIYTRSVSQFSVDCGSAHKGLFAGILMFVLSIVSIIMFFELFKYPEYAQLAVFQVNVWETVLFVTSTIAIIACGYVIKDVGLIRGRRRLELEHILLFVTQAGIFLYFLFQIIGGYFSLHLEPQYAVMRIVTPVAALVQSVTQTILVLDAWKRRCDTKEQQARRPGKQLVTFLLISNLAMWVVNRLKNSRIEFYPLQIEFYGVWAWTIIKHISLPLVVCYRFQSTVCLYEIWKHVYKTRDS